jgi:hypothetical protein
MQPSDVIAGVGIIPLLVGLVAVARGVGLSSQWAPVLALVLGVALEVGWVLVQPATGSDARPMGPSLFIGAVLGLMFGLGSCGLYSGTQAAIIQPMQRARARREAAAQRRVDAIIPPPDH